MNPKFQTHQIALPPELAGRRLDQALAQLLPQYSRTRIQRWIEEGAVRVNGLAARARDVVVGGETASVEARLLPETGVAAEKLPLDIVHEDAAVIVLNKAPGVVVHPGAGNREHTLQNALLAHDAKLKRVPRAGLVHRIDKDTSGLLVVARTLEAQTALVSGAGRARSRARVPRAVHRRHDRRRHRGSAHRPASHPAHQDGGAQ